MASSVLRSSTLPVMRSNTALARNTVVRLRSVMSVMLPRISRWRVEGRRTRRASPGNGVAGRVRSVSTRTRSTRHHGAERLSSHRCRPTATRRSASRAATSTARSPARRRASSGLHRDALGHDIPCEVRLVRLPSSGRRLIRGSITDITERKRSEFLAAGERRVFERITGNVDLRTTLEAITETAERVTPDALCSVSPVRRASERAAATSPGSACPQPLPEGHRAASKSVRATARAPRPSSCSARSSSPRSRATRSGSTCARRRSTAGLRACWSTPIRASDGRMLGTVALYFSQPRSPLKRDFELMARLTALAGIAIERKRSEEALRRSEAQYRGLFENVIEGVYRSTADGRFESVNPALVEHARLRQRRGAARAAVDRASSTSTRRSVTRSSRRCTATAWCATPNASCAGATAR